MASVMPVVLEDDLPGSAPSVNCVVGGVAETEAAGAVVLYHGGLISF